MILSGDAWHHFYFLWLEKALVSSELLVSHSRASLTLAKGTNQEPVPFNTSHRGALSTSPLPPPPQVLSDCSLHSTPHTAPRPRPPPFLVLALCSLKFQLANLINPFGLVGMYRVRRLGAGS